MADGIRGSFHGALGKSTLLPAARASEVGQVSQHSVHLRSQGALKRCSPTVCSAPHGLTFGVPRRSTAMYAVGWTSRAHGKLHSWQLGNEKYWRWCKRTANCKLDAVRKSEPFIMASLNFNGYRAATKTAPAGGAIFLLKVDSSAQLGYLLRCHQRCHQRWHQRPVSCTCHPYVILELSFATWIVNLYQLLTYAPASRLCQLCRTFSCNFIYGFKEGAPRKNMEKQRQDLNGYCLLETSTSRAIQVDIQFQWTSPHLNWTHLATWGTPQNGHIFMDTIIINHQVLSFPLPSGKP